MKFYEFYSLVVGFGALVTLTGFITGSVFLKQFLFCLNDPKLWVAIPEMILGLSAIPYFLIKIFGGKK